MFQLNGDIIKHKQECITIFGKTSLDIPSSNPNIERLLFTLKKGMTKDQIDYACKNEVVKDLFSKLNAYKLIVEIKKEYQNSFLEKTINFIDWHQGDSDSFLTKRKHSTILIIGCGGTGASTAVMLAASGFTNFILVDGDVVSETNLNRQIPFQRSDIGIAKVDVLSKYLKSINAKIACETYVMWVSELDNLIEQFSNIKIDLIVSGIDNPPIASRKIVAQFSLEKKCSVVFSGAGYDYITVGPLLIDISSKNKFISELSEMELNGSFKVSDPISGSCASINMISASLLTNELFNYFSSISKPLILNSQIIFDPIGMLIKKRVSYE